MDLQSFKVFGGSYAIYKLLQKRLGLEDYELSFADLTNGTMRKKLGNVTFAAATDGNHGRGVAWSSAQMGFRWVIYVHKLTSQGRIQAIENSGILKIDSLNMSIANFSFSNEHDLLLFALSWLLLR